MSHPRAREVRARSFRDVNLEPVAVGPDGTRRALVPLKASGTRTPLFFVHQGYGEVFQYKRVAERLRDDIPLYGLEARGLRDGLEPRTTVEEMATAYIEDIRFVQPRGPYLLIGFSFGGHVAWEITQQLEALGEEIRLLLVDIGPAITVKAKMNPLRKVGRIAKYHWLNYRGLEGKARSAYRVATFRAEVYNALERIGMDPTDRIYQLALGFGRKQQARGYFPVFRSSMRAMRNWDFEPSPRPFTLLRAELQPPNQPERPTLGFASEHMPGGIDVHPIPGSHSFVFHEPHVNSLTAQIEDWVDRQRLGDPTLTEVGLGLRCGQPEVPSGTN